MNLPNDNEIEEIVREFSVPGNVIRHSKFVWRVCEFIGKKLVEKGIKIDLELLRVATLLHDIDKIQTLENKEHGKVAYEYLKEKYPRVAEVVISHVKDLAEEFPADTFEKKILFYCDKIVQDEKIVLFEDRIGYLLKRKERISKEKIESIKKAMPVVKKIEKEIFEMIEMKPKEIVKEFNNS